MRFGVLIKNLALEVIIVSFIFMFYFVPYFVVQVFCTAHSHCCFYNEGDDFSFGIINCPHFDSIISIIHMVFIFYSSYVTLELTFYIPVTSLPSVYLTIKSRIFQESNYVIFQKFFLKISTPCWKVFYHWNTDDNRWYWLLEFISEMTIVSFLCLLIAFYTN